MSNSRSRFRVSVLILVVSAVLISNTWANSGDESNVQSAPAIHWNQVEGAGKYQIQISNSKDFAVIVMDKTVEAASFLWKDAFPGSYFWRVRAIDSENLPGEWSSIDELKISTPPISLIEEKGQEEIVHSIEEMNKPRPIAKLKWKKNKFASQYEVLTWEGRGKSGKEKSKKQLLVDQPLVKLDFPPSGILYWKVRPLAKDGTPIGKFSKIGISKFKRKLVLLAPESKDSSQRLAKHPTQSPKIFEIGAVINLNQINFSQTLNALRCAQLLAGLETFYQLFLSRKVSLTGNFFFNSLAVSSLAHGSGAQFILLGGSVDVAYQLLPKSQSWKLEALGGLFYLNSQTAGQFPNDIQYMPEPFTLIGPQGGARLKRLLGLESLVSLELIYSLSGSGGTVVTAGIKYQTKLGIPLLFSTHYSEINGSVGNVTLNESIFSLGLGSVW